MNFRTALLTATASAIALAGCTAASTVRDGYGQEIKLIQCGSALSIALCHERAKEECAGPYETISEEHGFNRKTLKVRCIDEATVAVNAGRIKAENAQWQTPATAEEAATAVDMMLANTLKDPLSSMQYSIGSPQPCSLLLGAMSGHCICYEVNAKNSYGGMTGRKIGVASLTSSIAPIAAQSIPDSLIGPGVHVACARAGLAPRDAQRIHGAVR